MCWWIVIPCFREGVKLAKGLLWILACNLPRIGQSIVGVKHSKLEEVNQELNPSLWDAVKML